MIFSIFMEFHENLWKSWFSAPQRLPAPETYIIVVISYVLKSSTTSEFAFFMEISINPWFLHFFHVLMEFTDFSENYENSWDSKNLEPQDMQNRAVIHTVSAIPALGGVQNRHFHEIHQKFMKINDFHEFSWKFMGFHKMYPSYFTTPPYVSICIYWHFWEIAKCQ